MHKLAKYINRSSQKFSEFINLKKGKHNKEKCTKYIPQKITLEVIEKSPIFKTPDKWISKFKFIDISERIQTYKPLENSCMSQILSSPPRMTHASRTVVPKDLLIPFRLMENPFESQDLNNQENKKGKFKYIIAPFHPDEKKVPEDPVSYYPRNLNILRMYSEKEKSNDKTINLKKFSINNNEYPNVNDWKSVGWNIDTWKVVEKINATQIMDSLKNMSPVTNKTDTDLILTTEIKVNDIISFKNDQILVNLKKLKLSNPELYECLVEKFPKQFIPINKEFETVIKSLMKYCILIDDNTN